MVHHVHASSACTGSDGVHRIGADHRSLQRQHGQLGPGPCGHRGRGSHDPRPCEAFRVRSGSGRNLHIRRNTVQHVGDHRSARLVLQNPTWPRCEEERSALLLCPAQALYIRGVALLNGEELPCNGSGLRFCQKASGRLKLQD